MPTSNHQRTKTGRFQARAAGMTFLAVIYFHAVGGMSASGCDRPILSLDPLLGILPCCDRQAVLGAFTGGLFAIRGRIQNARSERERRFMGWLIPHGKDLDR